VVPGPSTRDRRFACVTAVRTFHLNATRCRRFGTISQSLRYDQLFLHFIHHSVAFRAEFKRHRQNPPAQTLERAGKGPHLRNYDCTSVLLIWNSYLSSRTWRRYMAYDNYVAKTLRSEHGKSDRATSIAALQLGRNALSPFLRPECHPTPALMGEWCRYVQRTLTVSYNRVMYYVMVFRVRH
jgi:hypothetical protein